ncbi:MAG: SRPBCC family protein [Bacteroidaceae bacterium]|nr:SRPBCC family protein [Bacteroidaceae bacterium]
MKRIESQVKHIPYPQEQVYAKVADLSNLQSVAEGLSLQEGVDISAKNLHCTADMAECDISPVGHISLSIVSREPFKCIKMETLQSPIRMIAWVQIVSTGPDSCKIRVTLDADINMIMAKMIEKPLTQAVDKLADMLAIIPY